MKMPGVSPVHPDHASGGVLNTMAQTGHEPASNLFSDRRGFSATIWNRDSFTDLADAKPYQGFEDGGRDRD
jgi:hypothetical protein